MSVSPQIDALAAQVRRRGARQSPAARKQARRTADTFAADLPGIAPEHVGAVLLRAAVLAAHVFQADPGASARDVANLLGAAGQRLYHQAGERHPSGAGIVVDERVAEGVEALRLPERERLVHDDPALAGQIREGIAEAVRGATVDLGSFAQHLDGDCDGG